MTYAVAISHTPDDLPILVAGGGLSHGEHIVHEGPNVPLSNLFLTLLQHQGVETDTFGQSAGGPVLELISRTGKSLRAGLVCSQRERVE